jgi:hypothetical protein
MHKYKALVIAIGLLLAQTTIAAPDANDEPTLKSCGVIAKACKTAGFKKMAFWKECMKPILLNQSVKDIKLDAAEVKACRDAKISKMQEELKELEAVQ